MQYDHTDHFIPPHTCPRCGKVNDMSSCLTEPEHAPKVDDISMCVGCGLFEVVDHVSATELRMHPITDAEVRALSFKSKLELLRMKLALEIVKRGHP